MGTPLASRRHVSDNCLLVVHVPQSHGKWFERLIPKELQGSNGSALSSSDTSQEGIYSVPLRGTFPLFPVELVGQFLLSWIEDSMCREAWTMCHARFAAGKATTGLSRRS